MLNSQFAHLLAFDGTRIPGLSPVKVGLAATQLGDAAGRRCGDELRRSTRNDNIQATSPTVAGPAGMEESAQMEILGQTQLLVTKSDSPRSNPFCHGYWDEFAACCIVSPMPKCSQTATNPNKERTDAQTDEEDLDEIGKDAEPRVTVFQPGGQAGHEVGEVHRQAPALPTVTHFCSSATCISSTPLCFKRKEFADVLTPSVGTPSPVAPKRSRNKR